MWRRLQPVGRAHAERAVPRPARPSDGEVSGAPHLAGLRGHECGAQASSTTTGDHPFMIEPETSSRAREIIAVGRDLLEREGADALTMRRLADAMGIRAPSLYKHLPDKAAIEAAIIADGFEEAAIAFEAAVDGACDPLAELVKAYRAFADAHPHLYRLMTGGPLPRDRLPAGLEARTAAPLLRATGSRARARAAWAFIHGMIMLELNERFPPDGLTESAWDSGIRAFRSMRSSTEPQPDTPAGVRSWSHTRSGSVPAPGRPCRCGRARCPRDLSPLHRLPGQA
jgi:AcrR family transcriptional regulator